MIAIQVLTKTEYQDVYRVTNGVILMVKKFIPMKLDNIENPRVYWTDKTNSKIYHQGCEKSLKVLTKECRCKKILYDPEWVIPKGTVIYNSIPVVATNNPSDWKYEIKTTGNAFSGDSKTIEKLLNDILYTIRMGEEK